MIPDEKGRVTKILSSRIIKTVFNINLDLQNCLTQGLYKSMVLYKYILICTITFRHIIMPVNVCLLNDVNSCWNLQAVMEIYNMYRSHLSAKNMVVLYGALHDVALHAHKINSNSSLRSKLLEFGSMTQMQDPPLLRLENESYQICLTFLQNLIEDRPSDYEEAEVETHLVGLCQEVLESYIEIAGLRQNPESSQRGQPHWLIPSGSGKRRELAARAPLVVATLQAISSLGDSSFDRNLALFFPIFSNLISCEHGSNEVQVALSDMLSLTVGPVLLRSN